MSEASKLRLSIPVNERDHSIGPSEALVTVVSYGDYECPDCHRNHRTVEKIFDQLLDRVRFVYRHFPLVNVHPRALRAAEAAEAAAAQGKFWEMHRLLYTSPNKLEDKHLHRHARELGLDLDRFDRELSSNTYAEQIMKDYYNSLIHGITGTPTNFVDDELYAMTGVQLLEAIKATADSHAAS
jgi:protein-disulfide isomerase